MESARHGLPRTISEADRVLSIASWRSCDAARAKAVFKIHSYIVVVVVVVVVVAAGAALVVVVLPLILLLVLLLLLLRRVSAEAQKRSGKAMSSWRMAVAVLL